MFASRRCATVVKSLTLAVAAVLFAAQNGFAWTWEINEFDTGGTSNCGTKSSEPCLIWQEPHYTVITLKAYLDPSLNMIYYDFHPTLQNTTFPNYNTDPAYNPSFSACTTSNCGVIKYSTTQFACGIYAGTAVDSSRYGTPWYDSGRGQWNAYWKNATNAQLVLFSTFVTWNNSFSWAANCGGNDTYTDADGRKVAGHETGHVSSMGHTSYTALMHQGPENFYLLQSNDVAGLQAIYPGNYP